MSEPVFKEVKLSYGEAPYTIRVETFLAGKDIIAVVTGGTRPHVGAVALADTVPVIRSLTSGRHKDAVLAEMFALGLQEKYGVNVCVSAGVHIDNASKEEIALMVENAKSLLELLLASS